MIGQDLPQSHSFLNSFRKLASALSTRYVGGWTRRLFLIDNMQHLSKSAAFAKKAASFLRARQPVAASGAQLTTNVRVMASDEPFPTIAGMVEDLVYILQRALVARFKPNFLCDPGASAVHAKTQHTYNGPFVHLLLFRDAGESVVRAKILELELQLLQAENKIISDRLESWVAQIAR